MYFCVWVKMLGLREFKVSPRVVSAMFRQNDALKLQSGTACGQVWRVAKTENDPNVTSKIHSPSSHPAPPHDLR
jgi:hypothetical protein